MGVIQAPINPNRTPVELMFYRFLQLILPPSFLMGADPVAGKFYVWGFSGSAALTTFSGFLTLYESQIGSLGILAGILGLIATFSLNFYHTKRMRAYKEREDARAQEKHELEKSILLKEDKDR